MTEFKLDPLELHMLHHRRVREVFNAPELGRLLGEEGLDLSMTDQPEALKIRIEAGIAVLERRVLASLSEALRLQTRTCVFLGILLGMLVGMAIYLPGQPPTTRYLALGGLVLLGGLLACLVKRFVGVRGDLKLLARLRGRYHGLLEGCCDIHEFQAAAGLIYGEIRQVGGELPEEPDGRD